MSIFPLTHGEMEEVIGKSGIRLVNFVETGTYKGDTALMASLNFSQVYTVEISQNLFIDSLRRAEECGIENIHFYNGDSLQVLHEIVPKVSEGSMYFLDSCLSGDDTGWNGMQKVPLMEELDIILGYRPGPSVFVFNCMRFTDLSDIGTMGILGTFKRHGIVVVNFVEYNDRMWVFTG